jgi:hypothetical protein
MGIGWCCPRVGHARCWRCSCCNAGEVVSSDRIIDVFWGGRPPPTAPTVVHGLISRLRTALELDRAKGRPSALLPTVAGGHELAIDADDVGRQSEAPDAYRKVHAILAHQVGLPARPNAAGPIYGHPARTPLPSICPRPCAPRRPGIPVRGCLASGAQ